MEYLILNVLRPRGKEWPKHMNTGHAARLVEAAKPKAAVITHFGVEMLKAGPWKEARYIEEKTGVRTTAARDGMVITEGGEDAGGPKGCLKKWMA